MTINLQKILQSFIIALILGISVGAQSNEPTIEVNSKEQMIIGLRQRDLVILGPDQQEREVIPRSTYKRRVESSDYSFLMSFGFNMHRDHAIFIRNDGLPQRDLNFIIDRYFLHLSGGALFTIIFDSYEKKTFGITGHVGEVVVNGRKLPHGEIVVLEFSGFKALFESKKNQNLSDISSSSDHSSLITHETVTIPPNMTITTMEGGAELGLYTDDKKKRAGEGDPNLKESAVIKGDEPASATSVMRLEVAQNILASFDFEQIQHRVLSRIQSGLETILKAVQSQEESPETLFEKMMPEKIWKPLMDGTSFSSEGELLFAKESLEGENQLIYHRIPQLQRSILLALHSRSNPSPSFIPMVPKSELLLSKKAAHALNSARYREAMALYGMLYQKAPRSLYAVSSLGSSEYLCGENVKSIEHLEKAIEYAPYDGFSYGTLAIVKSQAGRVDEAIDDAVAAIALSADIPESYLALGIILHERGWNEESSKALEEGLTKNPNSAEIHRMLAKTLKVMGSEYQEKAEFHYKRSLQLGLKKDPSLF